ncbi:uncharacterized protein LOC143731159 [Siphateles boraxobius]|uniref:uncharacterized protein LOC143731159 n=1 Tax=Siphateles boraxobius TaxID=180520 RepID=UPI0040631269
MIRLKGHSVLLLTGQFKVWVNCRVELTGDWQESSDRIYRRSQGSEGVRFGSYTISSLLFADNVVVLAPSSQDLQHALGWLAAECEAAGIGISTSKSEAMVLSRKRVACPLQVGGEFLPQVEEFKYLGVLFMNKVAQLFEEEEDLLESFRLYIDHEGKNVEKMKSILVVLQLLTYLDPDNPEKTTRDPVAAYKLLRRVRREWLTIVEYTQMSLYEAYQILLDYAKIPQSEDLNKAASELIRLQEFYKLYPHNITRETSLNADEAYHMGWVAYDEDKFQHAFLWFLYSLDRLTEYSTTTEKELLRLLSLSAYHFGSLPVAIYFSQRLLNLGVVIMSDVAIGGATVFPIVGVALKPKKNGRVDWDTQHAGCPVLVGNKWVANKWIHEFGQEFRRPCSLSDWE